MLHCGLQQQTASIMTVVIMVSGVSGLIMNSTVYVMLAIVAERSEATNLEDGGSILS